jgi:hypothetical protein
VGNLREISGFLLNKIKLTFGSLNFCSIFEHNLKINRMENAQDPGFSQEEMNARKQEMLEFYKEQIDFLEVQVKFESLTAEIEEQRLKRIVALVRQAQIQSPPEEHEPGEKPEEGKKRTLRKEA